MTPEEFIEKGCYVCGNHNLVAPKIPFDPDDSIGREPYLLCLDCLNEYPYSAIQLLDDEAWEYGKRRREGELAIPTVYYKSEAQFDPAAKRRGFLTLEEEDVERPG